MNNLIDVLIPDSSNPNENDPLDSDYEPNSLSLSSYVDLDELIEQSKQSFLIMTQRNVFIGLREACSRGDVAAAKHMIKELGTEAEMIINSAPNGSNTLLFKACEEGQKEIVKLLIECSADERIHPVTRYSPLYVAAYYGRREICEILLKKFPQLVQVLTVEKWLPIHAATINGHIDILELLLKYPEYPQSLMIDFSDKSGVWQYSMPFDINLKDVTGQTVLYLACYLGNLKLAEMLLKYRIKAERKQPEPPNPPKETKDKRAEMDSPRRRITDSLASIMSRLSMTRSNSDPNINKNEIGLSPLDLDLYCNNNKETAVHAAVRKKHTSIVSLLLQNGANVNLTLQDVGSESCGDDDSFSSNTSTALAEACKNRDLGIIDMLLKNGATDNNGHALSIAVTATDEIIISKLLTLKSFIDPEYKINRKAMNIVPSNQFAGTNLFTYSSMFPTTSVMVNWHNMKCLETIREKWLVDACVHHNSKLKLNIKNQSIATAALTRLDLSNNMLSHLPICIFQLRSLRTLNVAQNKIRSIPIDERSTNKKAKFSDKSLGLNTWCCPVLEEILLQDNRLDSVPDCLFELPSLTTLDLSNNKLTVLPFKLWSAPKLRDLNLSLNMLPQLPLNQNQLVIASQYGSKDSSIETESISSLECSLESCKTKSITSLDRNHSEGEYDTKNTDESVISSDIEENDIVHHNLYSQVIHITDIGVDNHPDDTDSVSSLTNLNLSHNAFKNIPAGLSCFASSLARLNMSYNQLSDMSSVGSYPPSLKQLDLSYNHIKTWMTLHRGDSDLTGLVAETTFGSVTCYNPKSLSDPKLLSPITLAPGRKWSQRSSSGTSSNIPQPNPCCPHRRHTRLENLRTLILANNQLDSFNLFPVDDDFNASDGYGSQDSLDISSGSGKEITLIRSRLMFPNVSMLDLNCNKICEIPTAIPQLTNLSVLNLSNNHDISRLLPEMGLLSKLWNLNTRGCNLDEPLKSMIESKKYKTMDIIGYLKSILENAKLYARMKLMVVGIQGIGKTSLLDQLRQEGVGSYKKKPPEHWAKRMGNKNINLKTAKGVSMSTVGVDVGDWTFEKKVRGSFNYGPVMFRTWDFGGQREYYATHQYFLSKRSLYLAVWKITDGEKGVNEILHWLVNIQARAPNSPVIIVGTHYDLVKENFPPAFSEDLQHLIRERFINVVDADKCGLPKVLDTIEISCKTRYNIKNLCNLIYDTVFELRSPVNTILQICNSCMKPFLGSKERLLEQKIPATYLALEDVIGNLAFERKLQGKDPVLRSEQYKMLVMLEIQEKYGISFRDVSELNQATTFLHENGVLLHYEDATLKDLYFLDPQWLCDMLAHVVTIREINPFAKNGIMKIEDLKHVFKSSNCAPTDAKAYLLSLLNKFEVALTWDNRTLLIPSLLPTEAQLRLGLPGCDFRIPVRSRGWTTRCKQFPPKRQTSVGTSSIKSSPDANAKVSPGITTDLIASPSIADENIGASGSTEPPITIKTNPQKSIHRLLLMSYYPSGFWSRLITRMLADDSVVEIMRTYFEIPKEHSSYLASLSSYKAEWVCWQTGLELRYFDTTLFRIKEMLPESYLYLGPNTRCNTPYDSYDYRHMRFLLQLEGSWTDLNVSNSAILELFLPYHSIHVQSPESPNDSIVLHPSQECVAKLLAIAVDHVDTLLEDWYPTLGTRFVHTSEGKFLVTRLIPCSRCLVQQYRTSDQTTACGWDKDSWQMVDQSGNIHAVNFSSVPGGAVRQYPSRDSASGNAEHNRQSHSSVTSHDSGVDPDSSNSSRKPSVEDRFEGNSRNQPDDLDCDASFSSDTPVYSFMVEECILNAYENKFICCPLHGDIKLSQLAPDTVFADLGDRYVIKSDLVKRGKMLGRGAFGFVFKASIKQKASHTYLDVAMKMLQPVDPGFGARQSASAAYKAAWSKWQRDPIQYACKAYCTARQELNILLSLRHPHIVPFVGVCIKPLALVLRLAPQGALDSILRNYRRSGARLELTVIQKIILQIAKALEYLHQQHIIYRDLKSENVLVWALPAPFQGSGVSPVVDVKLADYGISRSTLPTGTKGFGGTEGFMAPEILKYNGEEEYTEKVDCFSFGMFTYELVTLHQPFEGYECVKDQVLEGGRPSLSQKVILQLSQMFLVYCVTISCCIDPNVAVWLDDKMCRKGEAKTRAPHVVKDQWQSVTMCCKGLKKDVKGKKDLKADRRRLAGKCTRSVGRHSLRLKDVCKRDLNTANIDIGNWEQLVKDRDSWRTGVREGSRAQATKKEESCSSPPICVLNATEIAIQGLAYIAIAANANALHLEMIYPLYILDLMSLCWSQQPQDRPSASQIVSVASAPEFIHLIDVVSLKDHDVVLSAGLVNLPQDEDNSMQISDIWFSRLGKKLDMLTCSVHGIQEYKSLTIEEINITSMTVAEDTVWLGTSRGVIHIYNALTYSEISSFTVDVDATSNTISGAAIRNLCYLPEFDRIAVASSNGRLWHCGANLDADGNFSNKSVELGSNGNPIHSMTCLIKKSKMVCELWCGQTQNSISIFSLKMETDGKVIVTSQDVIYHSDCGLDNAEVLQLVSSKEDSQHAWSYVYPGCIVYHWDATKRKILNKIDCSKLVPCSESMMSISIDEHLSPGRCQVTALAVLGASEIYIGTTWGCIVVAEGLTMRPITVFRPFVEEVKAILPVSFSKENSEADDKNSSPKSSPIIVSVGKGYRSLLSRYTTLPLSSMGLDVTDQESMYTLLWRSDNWLNL
ncbi:Leucine-rich repeat serine/threonine-protein kinase 1 [Nymphon striatum]|nr:Leucine-rich repeat serine/threonine-protein kinase 1 [Nymphon striatum]